MLSAPQNETSPSLIVVTGGSFLVCLLILLTIFGAFLVYSAFLLNKHLRTRTNLFFLSLVTADVLFAVFAMPSEIVHFSCYPYWPLGEMGCIVWSSLYVALGSASACHLCAIGIDRLLAISRPFQYYSDVSFSVVLSLTLLWIFAFFSGIASYHIWTQPYQNFCYAFHAPIESSILFMVFDLLVPFAICVLTYAKIFQISQQQARRIIRTQGWVNRETNALRVSRKSAKTVGLLVGFFALAFLPFLIFHALDGFMVLPNRFYFDCIVKWLTFANSSMNWLLYGYLNQEYRQALKKLLNDFGCFRCRSCRREIRQVDVI